MTFQADTPVGGFSLQKIDLPSEDFPLEYARQGLRVIFVHAPVFGGSREPSEEFPKATGCTCKKIDCHSEGKHPIARAWQKIATSDVLVLQDQRSQLHISSPNVGIVLGEQPGGQYLIAIDVDREERFQEIVKELGPLPETVRSVSGSGGYHLLFIAPAEVAPDNMSNGPLGGKPGVDAKVRNGQIVVAPSMHKSGRRYAWSDFGSIATLPIAWALETSHRSPPEWIHKYTPQTIRENVKAKNRADKYLLKALADDCSALAACGKGMRNPTLYNRSIALFSLCAGVFLGARWSFVFEELHRAALSCGLSEQESRKTINSAEKAVRENGLVRVPVALADPPATGTFQQVQTSEPQDTDRPSIRISTQLHNNVDKAVLALKADANLYQRDGKLVHVTHVTHEESQKSPSLVVEDGSVRHSLIEGSPSIRETSIATLRERLTRYAIFEKYDGRMGDYKPSLPTDPIVSAVHARGEWAGVRPIVGIVEAPTIRPDGIVIQDRGYDIPTGYLYIPSEEFPRVPDEPTQDQAKNAFAALADIFVDFPYVDAAHRAVPIAAILTLIARPAIVGATPAFLFDASTRGSGKTLQTDAIAMVLTGRGMPRMNYPHDEEELEKVLASYALRGAPFFSLDNVTRPFGGGALDRVITARDTVDLRVLGRSEVPTLCWRAVVLATGNNLTLYADTARRVLMARLEPIEEHPESRTTFVHDDLLGWVRKERTRLVTAALTLLRAYYVAKRPEMGCARWGSFEEWSRLIPHAIVFAGGADPMAARPANDSDVDTEAGTFRVILNELARLLPNQVFTMRVIVDLLFRSQRQKGLTGLVESDDKEDLRESIIDLCRCKTGTSPDAKVLGKKLGQYRGRVMDGMRLDSKPGAGGKAVWSVSLVGQKDQSCYV